MSNEAIVDQSSKVENPPQNFTKKSVENYLVAEIKNSVSELPSSTVDVGITASLRPVTPDSCRETGNFLFDFASPLTLISSPQKRLCFDSKSTDNVCTSTNVSPRTPVEGVFDPFAPGPDKLMLAPHSRKYLQESRSNVARQLNFIGDEKPETDAATISDDEILLETMYDNLLEAIFLTQAKDISAEILSPDLGSDGLKTPDSATRLTGIAETCPGAPMKRIRKSRNFNQGLCRKLEF